MSPVPSRSPLDPMSVALHALALAVWPVALAYTALRLLADRHSHSHSHSHTRRT